MKWLLFVLLVQLSLVSLGQKKFITRKLIEIKAQQDRYTTISELDVDSSQIDFVQVDSSQIERLFYSAVQKIIKNKDTIQKSNLLFHFAQFTSSFFDKKGFSIKRFDRLKKLYEGALPYFNTGFGVLQSYSFTVSVSDYHGDPYYDKNDSRNPLNLYIGTKEDKGKTKPLLLYNEKQFTALIQNELLKIDFIRENGMSAFSYIAFHYRMERDKKSDIPSMRFFVYFGAKRLKMVEEKLSPAAIKRS